MALGPVFKYELVTTSRRARYYVLRVAYGLFILVSLLRIWSFDEGIQSRAVVFIGSGVVYRPEIRQANQFATRAFLTLAWVQWAALIVVVPALTAGVIADARRRKTLRDLMASGLSASSIVLGKLGARFAQLSVLGVLGIPIQAIVMTYGVVDPWLVGYVFGGTMSLIVAIGGVSILVSTLARTPREAIFLAYVLEFFWLVIHPLLDTLVRHMVFPFSALAPLSGLIVWSHPSSVWSQMSFYSEQASMFTGLPTAPPWRIMLSNDLFWMAFAMVGVQFALGSTCIVAAVLVVRRVRGGEGAPPFVPFWKRNNRPPRSRVIWERPPCGDEPMLWKERYTRPRGGLAWFLSMPVGLVLTALLLAFLLEFMGTAILDAWTSHGSRSRQELNLGVRAIVFLLSTVWLVAMAGAASVTMTSEREDDTWTSLTSTLLTGREVVVGKIVGALWSGRWLGLGLLVAMLAGLLCGAIFPLGALLSVTLLVSVAWMATSLGVLISVDARNSTRAMVWTLLILMTLTWFAVVPFAFAFGSALEPARANVPGLASVLLLTYPETSSLLTTGRFAAAGGANVSMDIVGLTVVGIGFSALLAWLLTMAASERFEVAAGRARLSPTATREQRNSRDADLATGRGLRPTRAQ